MEKMIDNFKKLLPTWAKIIDKSFLEDEKKKEFKKLIRKKLKKFEIVGD
jgi:hypothetical protein